MDKLKKRLYDGSQDFTEDELRELVFQYEYDIIQGNEERWSVSMETIIEVEDKLFCIEWEEVLTECQEHKFYNQPYEVEKSERIIKVKEYIKK